MLAVDANVIVRIVTNDEPGHVRRAAASFEGEQIFIVKTVLLETEWVLRFWYRLSRDAIGVSLRKVVGLGNVMVENVDDVATALDWYEQGMDFAYAVHLAGSGRAGSADSCRCVGRSARQQHFCSQLVRINAGLTTAG